MPLPRSRKDREYQKFVDDGSGNTAVRVVVQGGSSSGTTVPPDGTVGYNLGVQFIDTDAVDLNRTWFNIGTPASSRFRRMPYLTSNAQLALESGTAANPTYAFANGLDRGMYDMGAHSLGFSTVGVSRIQINAATNINFGLQVTFAGSTTVFSSTVGLGRIATGMQVNVPAANTHRLTVNGVIVIEAGANSLGLYGVTPTARATTAIAASAFVANTSGIANDTATWAGYTMGQVVQALRSVGILT